MKRNGFLAVSAGCMAMIAGMQCPATDLPVASADPTASSGISSSSAPLPSVHLSPWCEEVLKLSQANVAEETILAYIESTAGTFNVGVDERALLRSEDVEEELVQAMVRHDQETAMGLRPVIGVSTPPASSHIPIIVVHRARVISIVDAEKEKVAGTDGTMEKPANAGASEEPRVSGPQIVVEKEPEKETFPVRKPYAEEIVPPIAIYRACNRAPNLVRIDLKY